MDLGKAASQRPPEPVVARLQSPLRARGRATILKHYWVMGPEPRIGDDVAVYSLVPTR